MVDDRPPVIVIAPSRHIGEEAQRIAAQMLRYPLTRVRLVTPDMERYRLYAYDQGTTVLIVPAGGAPIEYYRLIDECAARGYCLQEAWWKERVPECSAVSDSRS